MRRKATQAAGRRRTRHLSRKVLPASPKRLFLSAPDRRPLSLPPPPHRRYGRSQRTAPSRTACFHLNIFLISPCVASHPSFSLQPPRFSVVWRQIADGQQGLITVRSCRLKGSPWLRSTPPFLGTVRRRSRRLFDPLTPPRPGENSTWSTILIIICAMAGVGIVRSPCSSGCGIADMHLSSLACPTAWLRAAGSVRSLLCDLLA